MFRSGRFDDRKAGGTLGFYCDDYRLEPLWTKREMYLDVFLDQQWGQLVAPDFSLWADAPIIEQAWNVYRSRTLAREYQDAGIPVCPNLGWSTPESYEFCFEGIPQGCPVAFCQARNIRKDTSAAFLAGLHEAVRRIAPVNLVIYGKTSWLADSMLPAGPCYFRLRAPIDEMKAASFGKS